MFYSEAVGTQHAEPYCHTSPMMPNKSVVILSPEKYLRANRWTDIASIIRPPHHSHMILVLGGKSRVLRVPKPV